jgi:hypothetical protein
MSIRVLNEGLWVRLPSEVPCKVPMTKDQVYRRNLRQRLFAIYGTFCACCGETEQSFLTIEHIDGTGAEHRRQYKSGQGSDSKALYRELINSSPPNPNIRIYCFNCNWGKFVHGECPHQLEKGLTA